MLKDLEPIEYLKEGNLHGLSAEFLAEISRRTGLRFTYVPAATSQERVDMVKRGEADLISALRINGDVAARSGMLLTEPYHISAAIVITRVKRPFLFEPDQLNGMTVTLPFLDRYHDELRRKAPGATLVRGIVEPDAGAGGQRRGRRGGRYRAPPGAVPVSRLSGATADIGRAVGHDDRDRHERGRRPAGVARHPAAGARVDFAGGHPPDTRAVA
ncbi:transporter substrate-binding domain-containing protein [Achromobacter xylosoxidans]